MLNNLETVLKPNAYFDPLLVQRLATELQLRIGVLPKVEVYGFHLEAEPGEVLQLIRVMPRSLSEIARVIRAARTMKLTVRGLGSASGSEKALYADTKTVLVDTAELTDEPRMELIEIQREGEGRMTPGLRVLAGVTLDELTDFLVQHDVELCQWGDINTGMGTVVGNVVSAASGVFSPTSGAFGGCLADEVICMRILDDRGELIEYSTVAALREFTANMGLLGIVYDVVFRYRTMSVSKVNFTIRNWCELTNSQTIMHSLKENDITELIYMPYNRLSSDEELDNFNWQWCTFGDPVILRTCKRLPRLYDEDICCHPRHSFHIIDPIMGPDIRKLIENEAKMPLILAQAFTVLTRNLMRNTGQTQYTPWAVNSFAPLPASMRTLRFSFETGPRMDSFSQSMRQILETLMVLVKNEDGERNNGFNLCMRVQFTGGTRGGKLFGVGCLDPQEEVDERLLAHVTLAGFMKPGLNTDWLQLTSRLSGFAMDRIPRCLMHWKTEWHDAKKLIWHLKDVLPRRWVPFKFQIIKRDRDGVFLNECLQAIFFERPEDYQRIYRSQRAKFLLTI